MNGVNVAGVAPAMNGGGCNEVAVKGVIVNGRLAALTLDPRSIAVSTTKEELEAIMDEAKRTTWAVLEEYREG